MSFRVVYFGTPVFAETVLRGLLQNQANIVGVVTRTDKPQKRSSKLVFSPVKECALEKGIPLLQPERASDPAFVKALHEFDADIFIVVAYGAILRQEILDIPRHGCYNLHAGLLPAFRGAAPIQRCIMAGATVSGNTVIRMDAGMDTGDIVNVSRVPIGPDMTAQELAEALAVDGIDILALTLQQIESGVVHLMPQDHDLATLAPKISKEEGLVVWDRPASKVYAHIRGVTPSPGAWTIMNILGRPSRRLVIRKARLEDPFTKYGNPGKTLIRDGSLIVACSQGAVRLCEVQPEGKGAMHIKDFLNGFSGKGIDISF